MHAYGKDGHSHHGGHSSMSGKMFQSVDHKKAMILQKGEDAKSCSVCGMKLPMFYKTNHAAKDSKGETKQYCSIHCLVDHKHSEKTTDEGVVAVDTLKFIDAKKAFYVIASKKKGTMSKVSKYAFSTKEKAQEFVKNNGGKMASYEQAVVEAKKDF